MLSLYKKSQTYSNEVTVVYPTSRGDCGEIGKFFVNWKDPTGPVLRTIVQSILVKWDSGWFKWRASHYYHRK